MKIIIEQYDHKITYEVPYNDLNMEQMLEILERLLQATGYVFSGNLEIVDDSVEDERESFRIVDEPNEPKIRVGDATITTYDEFGVKHEISKQQEQ
jgi:hypothetical protein